MKLPPFILALLLATTAQAETNQAVLDLSLIHISEPTRPY